ncbi:MAG: hypothetical protein IPH62_13495 [Ignavibacteriae bacterium]|nr:hypothetical protein [Ignavibacteriota bacterium]
MNNEIIIVQEKLVLVMHTVNKIIKTLFHTTPLVLDYQNINNDERNYIPKLLIIDNTLFDKNLNSEIARFKSNFPNASIIIITLDNSQEAENQISKLEFVELLNVWNCNQSIAKLIASRVENKMNTERFN